MKRSDLLRLKLENKNNPVIRNLISTIIGELDRKSKDPSDNDVLSVIRKMKESDLMVAIDEKIKIELEFLDSLVPAQMSNDQLRSIVTTLEFTKIGEYMSYFKENYPGQYDGRELSRIVKEKLQ